MAKFYEMMKPILNMLKDGGYFESKQICELMNQQFPLTNEEIERKIDRGRKPDSSEEVRWALLYLTRAGLLDNPDRGIYAITDEGLGVLAENPETIDNSYLSKYESFRTFKQSQHPRKTKVDSKNDDIVTYRKQPTLLIGLGGSGSKIVNNIYGRTKDIARVSAFSIDTNMYSSQTFNYIPANHFVSISEQFSIADYVSMLPNARKWFPNHPILFEKTISDGTGRVRAVSRLAFEFALHLRRFNVLLDDAYKLAKECEINNCRMRVSIVTSLVGGTGSGIFIQTALLVKDYIRKHFPSLNVKIHGEFILPSNFLLLDGSTIERRNMESNAYAALKELNAINEHFFSNGSAVKLVYNQEENTENSYVQNLPYDYCFLYDRMNYGGIFEGAYIENAIIERLFSVSADALNDKFVSTLRSEIRKKAGNLYGVISTEKIPYNSTILKSDIFRSIINRTSSTNGKQILLVTSSEKLHLDLAQLPQETVFVEQIEPSATEITITELIFGVEISKVEKLKYNSGQYYLSYKSLVDGLPQLITPHLDKRWHTELHDIGSDEKNIEVIEKNESFSRDSSTKMVTEHKSQAFISYSSQDKNIADNLCSKLEQNGIKVWYAPRDVKGAYAASIANAIDNSNFFVIILSQNSMASEHVLNEIDLAFQNLSKGIKFKPLRIDNAMFTQDFKYYLSRQHWMDASVPPLEERLNEFVADLLDDH